MSETVDHVDHASETIADKEVASRPILDRILDHPGPPGPRGGVWPPAWLQRPDSLPTPKSEESAALSEEPEFEESPPAAEAVPAVSSAVAAVTFCNLVERIDALAATVPDRVTVSVLAAAKAAGEKMARRSEVEWLADLALLVEEVVKGPLGRKDTAPSRRPMS